ncbi:DUF7344 domain-containing protein [Haloplanus pelagicus]|jgi:hypothetical protein|uniref:DUF7344 domain-containing protein n=1 Tax=Haloplanus pelagicus TaxID=2949995 RepID=UPI002040CFA9|nr:hypothetical protein [Haloplanus sp. HW8-1]
MSEQGGAVRPETSEDVATAVTHGGETPTEQEVFDVLSNRRRRYALYALLQEDTVTIGSLADQVAAWENDCSISEVTAAERKRVYTALQQSHLPKLVRTGLVRFDDDSGHVELTEAIEELDIYLEEIGDERLSWDRYYLALSAVSAVVAVAVWLGVPPFGALPPLVWMAVVVVVFGVSAAVHSYRSTATDDTGTVEPPEVSRQS